jgi:SAM-dependent methyltransferase
MDEQYWDGFADEYESLVTDPFTYGRHNALAKQIQQVASLHRDVADFGCGPGKILPLLSRHFRRVYGYDFSNRLLEKARDRCRGLTNVEITWADLSRPVDHIPEVEIALCLNAAITPNRDVRMCFFHGMVSRIKPSGFLFLVVPAIESLLFSHYQEAEWQHKTRPMTKGPELNIDTSCFTEPRLMAQGIMMRGGEPTKHYLKEELSVLVRDDLGLDLIDIIKIEYDWKIEFEVDQVPRWLRDPYPWDWLVIAKQRRRRRKAT